MAMIAADVDERLFKPAQSSEQQFLLLPTWSIQWLCAPSLASVRLPKLCAQSFIQKRSDITKLRKLILKGLSIS